MQFPKPNLGLFDFNEEKNTNIVLIGSGAYGHRYGNSVIVDPHEPDAAKCYKLLYYDWATMPNGEAWAGLRSEPEPPTAKIKTPPDIGQITLKPIDLKARTELHVNANATGGAVWAEILDEDGFRVSGFDKAACVPLKKDTTRYRFAWKEKKLTDLPPGKHHIRLHLQKATVYAITLR